MKDPDEVFQNRHANLRAALDSVRKEIRGLPPDRAEEVLTAALRDRDAYFDPHAVRVLARQMSDPWWALRHPLQARRSLRTADDGPDQESARLAAESEGLSRRLEGVDFRLDQMKVTSRRTFTGVVHTVSIAPWSAEAAERIRVLAHPIPVTVRPLATGD